MLGFNSMDSMDSMDSMGNDMGNDMGRPMTVQASLLSNEAASYSFKLRD